MIVEELNNIEEYHFERKLELMNMSELGEVNTKLIDLLGRLQRVVNKKLSEEDN